MSFLLASNVAHQCLTRQHFRLACTCFTKRRHCAKSATPLYVRRTATDCIRYFFRASSGSASSTHPVGVITRASESFLLGARPLSLRRASSGAGGRPRWPASRFAVSQASFVSCSFCWSSVFPPLSGWVFSRTRRYAFATCSSVLSRDNTTVTLYARASASNTPTSARFADWTGPTAIEVVGTCANWPYT